MKKILVPCDFSPPAINAFRFALDTAARSEGTIYLLYVVELPALHDTMIMPVLSFEESYFKEVKSKTEQQFRKLIARYNTEHVKVIAAVEFGSTIKTILDYSQQKKMDFIVMGSHGAKGLRELFIGSNAEKIVCNSKVPVLVIKDYFKGPIKNIVFPNALLEDDQEDLAMKVKELQYFFKAHLDIVWINTPTNFVSDQITYRKLEEFAKRYMFKDYSLNVFNHLNEEEGIILFNQMVKGNLIALGTKGRKGIAHLMNVSIAKDIVNHSRTLVWTSASKRKK